MSLFQGVIISGCRYFRGVLISGCPYFRVSLFQGVLISGCPCFSVSLFQMCLYFRSVLISRVFLFQVYPYKMLYITLILKNMGSLYIDIYIHFVLFEGKAVLSRLGLYI